MLNRIFFIAVYFLALFFTACGTKEVVTELPGPVFTIAEDRGKKMLTNIEKFRLIDQFSDAHSLTDYSDKKSLILTAVKKSCIQGKENQFLESVPRQNDSTTLLVTADAEEKYSDYADIEIPTLFDRWQVVSRLYGLRTVGSFVEIDPRDGNEIRRGQIQFDILKKRKCTNVVKSPPAPSFSDVAPIFGKRCLHCHTGYKQIDYFTTLADVQKWSKMIVKTMEVMRMPPGGVDSYLRPVKEFAAEDNLGLLYHWANNGAKFSAPEEKMFKIKRAKQLALKKKNATKFTTPDYTFTMSEKHEIPPNGAAFYNNVDLAGPFEKRHIDRSSQIYSQFKGCSSHESLCVI